jgi:hypothetical protein
VKLLPLSKWLRHPAGVLVLYLLSSTLLSSAEEWLETIPNQAQIALVTARWARKIGRVALWVVFVRWQKMPWLFILGGLIFLYLSVFSLSGNFVANSCALLLAWTVYRLRETESSTAGPAESPKEPVQK